MRRIVIGLALVLSLAFAGNAGAETLHVHKQITVHPVIGHDDSGPLRGTETRRIERVIRIVPTDSDQDGFADEVDGCDFDSYSSNGGCTPPPPDPEPVPVAPTPEPTITDTASTAPPVSGGTTSGGCPSYMSGEASSPTDVNPDSGASGCYQVTPGTQAAMGTACSDVNSSTCVAAICAAQGNEAWAASGSTPCG